MKKQLGYYDEKKPSVFMLVFLPVLFILSLYLIIAGIINIFSANLYFGIALFLYSTSAMPAWFKKQKRYKKAKNYRDEVLKHGKKYKGRIINAELTTRNSTNRSFFKGRFMEDKIEYEHYALVEFLNEDGEKISFQTLRLNFNPEFITTKDVTVYSYNNHHYAMDFGEEKSIYVPPRKNWENFS